MVLAASAFLRESESYNNIILSKHTETLGTKLFDGYLASCQPPTGHEPLLTSSFDATLCRHIDEQP